jgi:hypothetical protein
MRLQPTFNQTARVIGQNLDETDLSSEFVQRLVDELLRRVSMYSILLILVHIARFAISIFQKGSLKEMMLD